jgi:hypothetical protein
VGRAKTVYHAVEYWTMWMDSLVCSKHKSLAAATREAKACEKRGGAAHDIIKVEYVKRVVR